MADKTHFNLSFRDLRSMIESLYIFNSDNSNSNNLYQIIDIMKIDNKRAVYLVRERSTSTLKVLKFIMQINTTAEQIDVYRYFLELKHPNFCKIELFESIDRFYMIVQEYIDGLTLDKYFNSNPKKKYKYKILIELICALDHIHKDNIIHGDIKPDNIIVRNNSPIIIDFDLSKDLCAEHKYKKIKPFGTPLYMSPEMINDQYFDAKTDIWSLGMTLYTCVVGRIDKIMCDKVHRESHDFDHTIYNISNKREYIQSECGKLFFNSICAMLLIDLDQRPSSEKLLKLLMQSKYFKPT